MSHGIERTSGVCGGDPCIAGTRIPIWLLEGMRWLGVSEADLLRSYPALRAEDLEDAWRFVREHHEEIEAQIRSNDED